MGASVAAVVAGVTVPVPTSDLPLPIEAFLALAFAVPAALTLPERLQWLVQGGSTNRMRLLRSSTSAIADLVCVGAITAAGGASGHPFELGGPLLALGAAYVASSVAARLGWLVVTALASLGLLTFGHSPTALVDLVPLWLGLLAWLGGFALYVVHGPREPR